MNYIVQMKYTDGVGGWTDWSDVAEFVYPQHARAFVRHVRSYQHEEAPVDQVRVRAVDPNVGAEMEA